MTHSRIKDGMVIAKKTYEYDEVGNRKAEEDVMGRTEYGYDDLYRLTNVNYPGSSRKATRSYGYDPNGNRTSMTTVTKSGHGGTNNYSYDSHNILQQGGAWEYSFHPDGNLASKVSSVSDETHEYSWDNKNQMVGFKKTLDGTTKEISYEYDASGRRVKRTDQNTGGTREWIWDGIAEFVTKKDGEIDSIYVNGLGGNIYRIDSKGNKVYYLKDVLGNVIATTDEYGNLLQRYVYDEFGECVNVKRDLGDDRGYTGKDTTKMRVSTTSRRGGMTRGWEDLWVEIRGSLLPL